MFLPIFFAQVLRNVQSELRQEQINSVIGVIQDVIEKLESLRLIEKDGDLIKSIQTEKIIKVSEEIDFINTSVERRIGWTCYYLYRQKKYVFSVQDIQKYNPTLSRSQIEKFLDRNIIPQWQEDRMA